MTEVKKRTGLAVLGVAALAGLGALFLFPKKSSAAPLEGEQPPEPKPSDGPSNPAEAYGLGTNPSMKDADYVLKLAQYLKEEGSHPDWAGVLQKRYYDLKAEELLGDGLKVATGLSRVQEIATTLLPTHNDYAVILGQRIRVQRGETSAPAPFTLPLLSGGSLVIDMSLYSPGASGGSSPGSPSGGSAPPSFPTGNSQPAPEGNVIVVPPMVVTAQPPQPPQPPQPAANVPPLAVEETKPENDPNGTIRLARLLLEEQAAKGWKYVSDAVRDWQKRVGLTADGKFGPGSAMRMAQEVAILPWIRYWPTGSASKQAAVQSYRGRLKAYALTIQPKQPEHAAALIVSANAENGQGWPATPAPAKGSEPTEAQVSAALDELTRMRKVV